MRQRPSKHSDRGERNTQPRSIRTCARLWQCGSSRNTAAQKKAVRPMPSGRWPARMNGLGRANSPRGFCQSARCNRLANKAALGLLISSGSGIGARCFNVPRWPEMAMESHGERSTAAHQGKLRPVEKLLHPSPLSPGGLKTSQ